MIKKQIKWLYQGLDVNNKVVNGEVEAGTEVLARIALRSQEITPISLKKKPGFKFFDNKSMKLAELTDVNVTKSVAKKDKKTKNKGKVKAREVSVFTKQLVVIIQSGVPLVKAFDIIIGGTANKRLVEILTNIRVAIENGQSMADSFALYPQVFDQLFINLVDIGEQGGVLETLLLQYIAYSEKMLAIKRKVKTALMYPIIVLLISTIVLSIIMVFVIPAFETLFASAGNQLPLPTLIVIGLSHFIMHFWLVIVGTIGLFFYITRYFYQHKVNVKHKLDSYILKVPLLGRLIKQASVSQWSRTLGLLFAAGVPLNEALAKISNLMGNSVFQTATLKIKQDVESGIMLNQSAKQFKVFPNIMLQMLEVGEESGSLTYLLASLSDYLDEEVNLLIETILGLIEPLTIVFLGTIIGTIIIAIYMPLFQLGDNIG